MFQNLLGKFLCKVTGHLRGKFLRAEQYGKVKIYACPRCQRETKYKAKAAQA